MDTVKIQSDDIKSAGFDFYIVTKGRMKKTFYVGLADKDTKQAVFTQVEGAKILMQLVGSQFGGGTIYSGKGFYTHEDGSTVTEDTLIVTTTTSKPHADFIAQVKTLFNQESIMVEVENVTTSFE